MNWYQMESQEVMDKLNRFKDRGLSQKEVVKRQRHYGKNELQSEKGPGFFRQFAAQFKDFMILTLLAAAGISFFASYAQGEVNLTDPLIILAIVILNALLGIYQEKKAEHSLAHLRSLQTPQCQVLRDGKRQTISSPELVPGDLVYLDTGWLVPADGRLLLTHNLSANESALTGETGSIEKTSDSLHMENLSLGDQLNMVFSGTMITTGNGLFCVTETGMNTQIGKIAGMLSHEQAPQTPLTRRLNHTGKVLGILALIICAILFFLGLQKNQPVFDMFMTSVSLGVAAIPESLPALVTIMLSLGVERMAKQCAIIRHLPAVETLGSASVICSDKTGTLTQNRMTVRNIYSTENEKTLLRYFLLCNNQSGPLEHALIHYGASSGLIYTEVRKEFPVIEEIPFDSIRKRMTTLHRTPNGYLAITKGAPEFILANCHSYLDKDGSTRPLTHTMRHRLNEQIENYTANALRVIAPELPYELRFIELGESREHISINGYEIDAFKVNHAVTCYGYAVNIPRIGKFDVEKAKALEIPQKAWNRLQHGSTVELDGRVYTPDMVMGAPRKGLKVTYCTDSRPVKSISENAQGSDLFICEGMYGEKGKESKAREYKHMTFVEAAHLAREAQVKEMWLTHFSPSLVRPADYVAGIQKIFPNVQAGTDGKTVELGFED